MEKIFILCIIAYIIGSVNFSILLFSVIGKGDPRTHFSGNPGTTNIYRQAGLWWAAFILLLDLGKAVCLAFMATAYMDIRYVPFVSLFLLIGNRYPVFHNFRGGKGVAAYLGFVAALEPVFALLSCGGWVAAFFVSRRPFIASFVMVYLLSIGMIIFCKHYSFAVIVVLVNMAFIYFNHRNNIMDLFKKKNS